MAEYIEREAAIAAVKGRFSMPVDNLIAEVIGNIPAADVVERPRWIPVEEGLPKDEKDVLAYYGFLHNGVLSSQRHIGILAYFAFDPNPHWQYEGQGFLQVTHWRPLPEPPAE